MKEVLHIDKPRKIILFPYSGGSKFCYNNLISNNCNATIIEYPGRGLKVKEKLIKNIYKLVEDIFPQFKEEIKGHDEFIIYGHSLGALVGYLVCKKIQNLGFRRPSKLIVSGSMSPNYQREDKISELPHKEFWERVLQFGGIPDEFNKHPELVKFFLPILKADFSCAESFDPNDSSYKMSIPIDVIYGTEEEFSDEQVKDWQNFTTGKTEFKQFNGNHFFLFNHKEFFIEYFNKLQLYATI